MSLMMQIRQIAEHFRLLVEFDVLLLSAPVLAQL